MTEQKKTEIPAGAKKPTDRQAKVEDAPMEYAVTVNGVDFTVPAEALDDFELLDDLNALEQGGSATRLPAILRRFLGDDQYRSAMDSCRDPKTGRVSVEAGANFVSALMEGVNPSS